MEETRPPARKRLDLRRIFIISGLSASIIIYAVLWLQMIASPGERSGADFIIFYAAGRIYLTGDHANVFDPQAQLVEEQNVIGFPIPQEELAPFNHPPFILPILIEIASMPYVKAFSAWAILLCILFGLNALVLLRAISQFKQKLLLFLSMVLFFPAFVSVLDGQDTVLLLLGASLWLWGMLGGDDRLAGLGLALTLIRPQIALVLALPFLFRRRKVFWWFLLGALGLTILSVILIGIQGVKNFIDILSISVNGVGYKMNEIAMVNLIGLFQRLFPDISPGITRLAGWVIFAGVLVFLCILWWRSCYIQEKHLGLAVLLALFASPHLHYHDLTLLLIPIVCLMVSLKKGHFLEDSTIVLLPLAFSWIFLLSNSLVTLKYNLPYLLGLFIALVLWKPLILFNHKGKINEIVS